MLRQFVRENGAARPRFRPIPTRERPPLVTVRSAAAWPGRPVDLSMPNASAPRALQLGSRTYPAQQRLIMAIVNRTPDSFYDQGATWDEAAALDRVHQVVADGADILDIGGVAAAPGAPVDVAEEIRRTVPFVAAVRAAYPDLVISVDTWRHEVAREACQAGADLLNDTWGGQDPRAARGGRRVRRGPGLRARRPADAAHPAVPGGLRRRDGRCAGPHPGPGRRGPWRPGWTRPGS